MVRIALLIAAAAPAAAFNVFSGSRVQKSHAATSYRSSLIMESFGFDFAEDSYENTPEVILGESRLKTWVNSVNDNAFLNRQVRSETSRGETKGKGERVHRKLSEGYEATSFLCTLAVRARVRPAASKNFNEVPPLSERILRNFTCLSSI